MTTTTNPLLAPWTGPHGGTPPFDRVQIADLAPALDAAMAEQLAAIEMIAANPAPPTFDNTLAAYERSTRLLDRVLAVYGVFTGCLSDPALQDVERDMAPRLAAFQDRLVQHRGFLNRVAAVHAAAGTSGLAPEQQRLAWLVHTNLVHAGACLPDAAQQQLSAINQRLAECHTAFAQNVLREETDGVLLLDEEADVAGLPESVRRAAADAAVDMGHPGAWAILNTRSSVEPFLTFATRRDLRERAWRMFVGRCDHGGPTDNNAVVTEILALRASRARLLGFPTHAHWRLDDSMAKSPERADELMRAVWTPAVARVRGDVAAMQAIADADAAGLTIAPWDYRFYAEKVRAARYDLDEAEVSDYLQLDRLRDGMFFVAERLFGLRFREVIDGSVPVYHPDVRVWEMIDTTGATAGLWFFDPFARAGKRSGAWMSDQRSQDRLDGDVVPIVSNVCNFLKPPAGAPALLSWDDATTLFHEFGHALHGLCSSVTYPSLSGTRVARDYVELPSQVLEHWLATPEVLQRFAVHHRTGRPMPAQLVDKVLQAKTFNEGFRTVEFLASAIVDMDLHRHGDGGDAIDPAAFEQASMARLGMPKEIVMRHRIPHFSHLFADDGYSAGYYSYLWADVLTADAWEAFLEAGGPWDDDVAARLHRHVLAAGNAVDPAEGYRAFRGRDATVDALMRKRGFAAED